MGEDRGIVQGKMSLRNGWKRTDPSINPSFPIVKSGTWFSVAQRVQQYYRAAETTIIIANKYCFAGS